MKKDLQPQRGGGGLKCTQTGQILWKSEKENKHLYLAKISFTGQKVSTQGKQAQEER